MLRITFVLFAIFLNLYGVVFGEFISSPVVNIYRQPQEATELASQAIYGNYVEVLDLAPPFSKIKTRDGVEGWILSSQIITNPSYEQKALLKPTKNLFAHVYSVTDTTPYPPLLTLPYGSMIKLHNLPDMEERWVEIELLSGEKAWIQRGDIDFSPQYKTLEETLTFSRKFLGLPYTWGGTSSYGFDCSGFVQMLFREMGIQLPRNSRNQAQSSLFYSVTRENLQPGDLLFFGTSKINHVGLYLGDDEFIHSGVTELPIVMISSLKNEKYHFLEARRLNPLILEKIQTLTFVNDHD